MLENLKLLLGNSASEELLELLISQAQNFLLLFCGLSEYDERYDSLIIRMVVEDFNKMGSEGVKSRSFNGLSETYNEEPYSSLIMTQLRSYKRLRTL